MDDFTTFSTVLQRGEDGAEVELCPGKTLKKILPTATSILMTPSGVAAQIVSWNDGSVLLSTVSAPRRVPPFQKQHGWVMHEKYFRRSTPTALESLRQ
jgi:hypothetical protein